MAGAASQFDILAFDPASISRRRHEEELASAIERIQKFDCDVPVYGLSFKDNFKYAKAVIDFSASKAIAGAHTSFSRDRRFIVVAMDMAAQFMLNNQDDPESVKVMRDQITPKLIETAHAVDYSSASLPLLLAAGLRADDDASLKKAVADWRKNFTGGWRWVGKNLSLPDSQQWHMKNGFVNSVIAHATESLPGPGATSGPVKSMLDFGHFVADHLASLKQASTDLDNMEEGRKFFYHLNRLAPSWSRSKGVALELGQVFKAYASVDEHEASTKFFADQVARVASQSVTNAHKLLSTRHVAVGSALAETSEKLQKTLPPIPTTAKAAQSKVKPA